MIGGKTYAIDHVAITSASALTALTTYLSNCLTKKVAEERFIGVRVPWGFNDWIEVVDKGRSVVD